jgi:hypothetical protein
MVPIFSGLFKFFYLQSGSYIREFEYFYGIFIGKIAILSGCFSLFFFKIVSTTLMQKGNLRAYPIKKYIFAGDRVLPFPVFRRTSLQWQYDIR